MAQTGSLLCFSLTFPWHFWTFPWHFRKCQGNVRERRLPVCTLAYWCHTFFIKIFYQIVIYYIINYHKLHKLHKLYHFLHLIDHFQIFKFMLWRHYDVIKIYKWNNGRTIADRAYCCRTYETLSLCAFTGPFTNCSNLSYGPSLWRHHKLKVK